MPMPHVTLRKKEWQGVNDAINERASMNESQYSQFRRSTHGGGFGDTAGRPGTSDPMAQTLQKWRESIKGES